MKGYRFWEFYLVRYLLGTIFGVVILFFLVLNYNQEITAKFFFKGGHNQTIEEHIEGLLYETTFGMKKSDANIVARLFNDNSLNFVKDNTKNDQSDYVEIKQTGFPILAAVIFAIAGFLYMYFSSMIILVLHGLRLVFFETNDMKNEEQTQSKINMFLSKNMNKLLIGFTVFSVIVACIFNINTDAWHHAFSIMILLSVIGVFLSKARNIKKFYKDLSQYRAKNGEGKTFQLGKIEGSTDVEINIKSKNNRFAKDEYIESYAAKDEYIESYRHLREHGNAFGIIVCEILFAFWLIKWDFSVWAIFYWSLFGFIAWILGSYLEVFRDVDIKENKS